MVGVDDDRGGGREHAQRGGAQRVEPHALQRVGHHPAVGLLGTGGAGHAAVGPAHPAFEGAGGVLERLALEQPGQEEVALLEAQQLLVELEVLDAGEQAAGLELDQRGGDEEELGGDVEVERVHAVELGEVGVDDLGQRHLPQLHLLLQDQVKEEVEGALEDRGAHRVRHRVERTGHRAPEMTSRMPTGPLVISRPYATRVLGHPAHRGDPSGQLPGCGAALGGGAGAVPRPGPDPVLRRRPPRAHPPLGPHHLRRGHPPDRHAAAGRRARPGALHAVRAEPRPPAHRPDLAPELHRHLRRAAPDDPIQGEVRGSGIGQRRALRLPRPHGQRRAGLRHRARARRRRPAPAPRARPRPRHPVQPPVRRDPGRARGEHPAGRGPDHGPPEPDGQDVEVARLAPGDDQAARRPHGHHQADQERGHRLRQRDPLRPGRQARGVEPAADPRRGHRRTGRGGGGEVLGFRVRRAQDRGGGCGGRVRTAVAGALRRARTRPRRGRPHPRRGRRPGAGHRRGRARAGARRSGAPPRGS